MWRQLLLAPHDQIARGHLLGKGITRQSPALLLSSNISSKITDILSVLIWGIVVVMNVALLAGTWAVKGFSCYILIIMHAQFGS